MQECCVINWGKGCLYHGCSGLVTEVYDKSQKTSKDNQKNSARKFCSLLYYIVCGGYMLHVGMVGYPLTHLW